MPFGMFLDALRERFPLPPSSGGLLALDDLHWADEASIDLLASLLRRPPAGRLVL
ncbi:hypothetical protein N8J89_06230 [Crossiella sp. CA-258035]|uniref:AAA family ATPase n=1 Tax=Crossiella sp. CA-258035 TaxID=2981138 RepID=UPI0024BC93A4|nr:AAA family ATPase [Crossiella sp. CA-258035]WHT20666.1 hypothetical protein N8J89_06230 [Crossiella sp. CA-258035]